MIAYRLEIDGVDWSCHTLATWTVVLGREDPDTQPSPGRAQWTMVVDGAERAPMVQPGANAVFTASVQGGPRIPIASMQVGDVTRGFDFFMGYPRNTITIDANGATAMLGRVVLEQSWGNVGFTHTDSVRVLRAIQRSGLDRLVSPTRTPTNRVVNDTDGTAWTNSGVVQTNNTWRTVARNQFPLSAGWTEGELVFHTTSPCLLRFDGHRYLFATPGTHILDMPISPRSSLSFEVMSFDPATMLEWNQGDLMTAPPHGWQDTTATTWDSIGGGTSGTFAVKAFTAWDVGSGWPYDGDLLTNRYPVEDETALAHIQTVAGGCRGALWEARDGTFYYTPRVWRSKVPTPAVLIDACSIMAQTSSTVSGGNVVNRAVVPWGDLPPGGQRPEVSVQDASSMARYGARDWNGEAPILFEDSARAIAEQVVASHKEPHEYLDSMTTRPLEELDDGVASSLLRLMNGDIVGITGAPSDGWIASGTWKGFLEGTTLSGTHGSTTMSLSVSEYVLTHGYRAAGPEHGVYEFAHESAEAGRQFAAMTSPAPAPLDLSALLGLSSPIFKGRIAVVGGFPSKGFAGFAQGDAVQWDGSSWRGIGKEVHKAPAHPYEGMVSRGDGTWATGEVVYLHGAWGPLNMGAPTDHFVGALGMGDGTVAWSHITGMAQWSGSRWIAVQTVDEPGELT